jgi:hypothetical protein
MCTFVTQKYNLNFYQTQFAVNLPANTHALIQFGKLLREALSQEAGSAVFSRAVASNLWFTEAHIRQAVTAWADSMCEEEVMGWSGHELVTAAPKEVGLILAGNIPLVGLHDVLCVLLSGHRARIKCSSDDAVLIPWACELLAQCHPNWKSQISFSDKLNGVEALIATGSNNSSRYFEYYFRHVPHIIRKNRHSVAVLTGNESEAALKLLGNDVFDYFGLGCRNVSMVWLPAGFELSRLFEAWEERCKSLLQHPRYVNNFDYHLAILMVNRELHYTNNAVILQEKTSLSAAISVLHYAYYQHPDEMHTWLEENKDQLQCVVSAADWVHGAVGFGESQQPHLWDYADGVNTLDFLQKL